MTTVARRAVPSDAGIVGDALASAFTLDPLWNWFTGRDTLSETYLRRFFRALATVNLTRPDHEVYLSDDGAAAAIWYPPGRWELSVQELARVAPSSLVTFRVGSVRVFQFLRAVGRQHPRQPHYYLDLIGTRVASQRQGLGSAVLRPILERCDSEGIPAYLLASAMGAPLYARHGFVEMGEVQLPRGCPRGIPMWREPKRA